MRKSKKILSVTLALIMVLGVMVIGVPTMTAGAAGGAASVSLKSTAYNSNATVTIGWQKGSGGATGFQIAKKKLGDKSYSYFYVGGGNTKSYNDKSVVCGTIYYYQVRTVYKVGKNTNYGAWSNSKTITTLYRPTITSMNYISYNLNINWNSIKGVSHYRLAFKRTTDKAWNYRDVKNTYFNVSNPTKGTTYTIQVCPMNGTIAGQWSLVKSIDIAPPIEKPVIKNISYNNNTGIAKVEWTNTDDCDGYIVYYKSVMGDNWSSSNVGDRESFSVKAEPGNTYYFQLRAYKQGEYSPYSNVSKYYVRDENDGDIVDEQIFGGENNITLKVWVPDKAVNLVKKQVENFKSAYPGVTFKKIDVVAMGEGSASSEIFDNPNAAADVFSFGSEPINRLAEAYVIAPVAFDEHVSEINAESAVNAATYNGQLYAYPRANDNSYYLVYDKRVVSATQAQTLEGVLAACKAKGKKFVYSCSDAFYSCAFAFTGGVTIDGFEADGYTQKFADYDEDEAVATLQVFSKLMHDYKGTFVSLDAAQIASGFYNGSVGAGVDGTWNAAAEKNALGSNFGAAKLPTITVNGEAKQMIPMQGYFCYGVNSYSRYPAAAQILALYLSGEKCQRQNAEQIENGPTNKVVSEEPVVKNNPILNIMNQQAAFSVPQVNVAPTFWEPMGDLGSKLVARGTNPDDKTYFVNLLNNTIADIQDYDYYYY